MKHAKNTYAQMKAGAALLMLTVATSLVVDAARGSGEGARGVRYVPYPVGIDERPIKEPWNGADGVSQTAYGQGSGEASILDVRVDPALRPFTDEEIAGLDTETRGSGFLILRDGDVLRGRVLTEGFIILPGARIYYDDDVELISSGDINLFLGKLVPLFTSDDGGTDEYLMEGGIAGSIDRWGPSDSVVQAMCQPVNIAIGTDGQDAPNFTCKVTSSRSLTILDATECFSQFCDGPLPEQNGESVIANGTPSAVALGGSGGKGGSFTLNVAGKLRIDGTVCNNAGGHTGDATATGADGEPCACGGDAWARSKPFGGPAGRLRIFADEIVWNAPAGGGPRLIAHPGGKGGMAKATGGKGGDCNDCHQDFGRGGRGGSADANGGWAGWASTVRVAAVHSMTPPPAEVLAEGSTVIHDGAAGGDAEVKGGSGGKGATCPCPSQPGDRRISGSGGLGGRTIASGGNGAPGFGGGQFSSGSAIGHQLMQGNVPFVSQSGRGGNALAEGGLGGPGGDSGPCPCDHPGKAGQGGSGGGGGSALAFGGDGGTAHSNVPNSNVKSGNGGNASAWGAGGGKGGRGGNCVGDEVPINCVPGDPGHNGIGGGLRTKSGAPGEATGEAIPGEQGIPQVDDPIIEQGPDGLPGDPGTNQCGVLPPLPCDDDNPPTDNCCHAADSPGCENTKCCMAVCLEDPFCCEVSWDQICANAALTICEWLKCEQKPGDECPWDLNGDGVVDFNDLQMLLDMWGECPDCEDCPGDFNGDCVVDSQDQVELMANFGPCP